MLIVIYIYQTAVYTFFQVFVSFVLFVKSEVKSEVFYSEKLILFFTINIWIIKNGSVTICSIMGFLQNQYLQWLQCTSTGIIQISIVL